MTEQEKMACFRKLLYLADRLNLAHYWAMVGENLLAAENLEKAFSMMQDVAEIESLIEEYKSNPESKIDLDKYMYKSKPKSKSKSS